MVVVDNVFLKQLELLMCTLFIVWNHRKLRAIWLFSIIFF